MGTGRAESNALGGVNGRGFWLSGTNRVEYPVPAQPRNIRGASWYVAIFVDPRVDDDSAARALLTFPDGSGLRLEGRHALSYVDGSGAVVHSVALPAMPASRGWVHLALAMAPGNREVTLLLDGFAFDAFTSSAPLFELTPGTLVVGTAPSAAGGGVRGWIDDFKVLAHRPDAEVACNHAAGTLVGLTGNAEWGAVAERYPAWAHEGVSAALAAGGQRTFASYACFHDYGRDHAAYPAAAPAGSVSVRRAIHFPEGPLHFGAARPDSSRNPFCLTCHVPGAPAGSLAALEPRADVNTEDDRRRQPSQPMPRVNGNIPAHWIAPGTGPGGPDAATTAPDAGAQVDRWVLAGD
ncbi:MAG: hypothetical protein IPK07_18270 [Deltaproteobacteria bacterium]|nr:hypothetical protein [Deltaproteobacteria bacterium]